MSAPGGPPRSKVTSFAAFFTLALSECRPDVTAYGACIQRSLATLEKDVCAREFAALSKCAAGALARARGRTAKGTL
jgi:hypothetical protein